MADSSDVHARLAQLERENAQLRAQLTAGTKTGITAFTDPVQRLPPGHTPFSWAFGAASDAAAAGGGGGGGGAGGGAGACPREEVTAESVLAKKEGFLQRIPVRNVLAADRLLTGKTISVCGWARTVRLQEAGALAFVELYDGSSTSALQVVVPKTAEGFEAVQDNAVAGTCFLATGEVVESPAKGQSIELKATSVVLLGSCPAADYPIAKGKQKLTLEHLRTVAHLRSRTNTIGSMMRVRNVLAFAVHEFFQRRDFFYVHAPLITSSDCEGAGEMFAVTTLLKNKVSDTPTHPDGTVDYAKDFFSAPTFLTVSGQLEAEAYACGMSKVYTFGPTFRAEDSHTTRHLAEFWMIEPEIAFGNLSDVMDLGEAFLKHCCAAVLAKCQDELAFFESVYPTKDGPPLRARLQEVVSKTFVRLPYKEAVEALLAVKDRKWDFPPAMGADLASEHEKYITDVLVGGPTFVTNWPKGIKSFYMRVNEDNETVAAVDCLLPRVGEIIGGSQREERLDVLRARMAEMKVSEEHLKWYLDLRRYGSCPHAGFGLGFERMVLFCTGLENIRDVIPFPRYPGHAEF